MRTTSELSTLAARGVLLLVGVLLAGCGGAQGGTARSAAAPHGPAVVGAKQRAGHAAVVRATAEPPRHPQLKISAARASDPVSMHAAEAFARAVNLTPSDVPGAVAHKRERHSKSPRQKQRERRAFASCLGVQPAHKIVTVKSPQLDRGVGIEGETFTSSITVVAHPPEAEREIDAVQRFHDRPCLQRLLLASSHGRVRLGAVHISLLHTQVFGATASAGLRVEVMFRTTRGISVPFYTDVLAFALGSAEIQLEAFSVAQPVAPTTEQQLLSLLAARARAHPL
jgi:hypothetical protein